MTASSVQLIQSFDCRECKHSSEIKTEGAYSNVFQWRCPEIREAKEVQGGKCFERKEKQGGLK